MSGTLVSSAVPKSDQVGPGTSRALCTQPDQWAIEDVPAWFRGKFGPELTIELGDYTLRFRPQRLACEHRHEKTVLYRRDPWRPLESWSVRTGLVSQKFAVSSLGRICAVSRHFLNPLCRKHLAGIRRVGC